MKRESQTLKDNHISGGTIYCICHEGATFYRKEITAWQSKYIKKSQSPPYLCTQRAYVLVLSYDGPHGSPTENSSAMEQPEPASSFERRWVRARVRAARAAAHWLRCDSMSDAAIWMNLRAATSSPTNWAQQNVADPRECIICRSKKLWLQIPIQTKPAWHLSLSLRLRAWWNLAHI